MTFWHWLRNFAERRMNHGCMLFCGTDREPFGNDTPTWSGYGGRLNFCKLTCRKAAEAVTGLGTESLSATASWAQNEGMNQGIK